MQKLPSRSSIALLPTDPPPHHRNLEKSWISMIKRSFICSTAMNDKDIGCFISMYLRHLRRRNIRLRRIPLRHRNLLETHM